MRKTTIVALLFILSIIFTSCMEHYSDGERIGYITQFSKAGMVFKSWEGHLNMTQTGTNSSSAWDFSIDNDNENAGTIRKINEAVNNGNKVKLTYHKVAGFSNFLSNRGHTDFMIDDCIIMQ